ncbi:MAG: AAA family ATPase [Actinomycetota bacterium]
MRFTLRPGIDPVAEADGTLLRAMGLPSGGVVRVGRTHVVVRPAEVAGNALLIGPIAAANSGLEHGASAEVVRAIPTQATRVEVESLPVGGSRAVTALQGRVVTAGDTVTFELEGQVHEVRVIAVEPGNVVLIGPPTQITADHETGPVADTKSRTAEALLAGLDTEIDVLTGWFSLLASDKGLETTWGMPQVAGITLTGPLGCGKAELVDEAARRAGTAVEHVDTSLVFKPDKLLDLLAAAVNDSPGPKVIFVDRIEAVIGGSSISSFRTQALAIVRWFLDAVATKPGVACVLGVESLGEIDESVSTSPLLPRSLAVPPPDLDRRRLLFDAALHEVPSADLDNDRLAALSSGFSGADILAAVLHASAMIARTGEDLTTDVVATAIRDTPPSLGAVPMGQVTSFGFDKVANLDEVKQRLVEAVVWPMQDPARFERLGIDPPKGILLHGPPGTGKTFVVKALANEAGAAFFSVKGAELLDKYVGESERGVRDVFNRARAASPSIIFFDEFDALAPVRGNSTNSVTDSVVAALLTEIDGVADRGQVSVIAATNRKDLIDPALLRAGRFETHLYLGLPPTPSRLALLNITDVPLADDVDLNTLAEATEGLSFADLTGVLREAALIALRQDETAASVTRAHVEAALERFGSDRRD